VGGIRAAWTPAVNSDRRESMKMYRKRRLSVTAVLLILGIVASLSGAARGETLQELSLKSIAGIVGNIVNNPEIDSSRYVGEDDCRSETVFFSTVGLMQEFANDPFDSKDAMKQYIFADPQQCNCTRAIIGKDFDILLESLGTSISQAPCY
jgi:hypothetical protein